MKFDEVARKVLGQAHLDRKPRDAQPLLRLESLAVGLLDGPAVKVANSVGRSGLVAQPNGVERDALVSTQIKRLLESVVDCLVRLANQQDAARLLLGHQVVQQRGDKPGLTGARRPLQKADGAVAKHFAEGVSLALVELLVPVGVDVQIGICRNRIAEGSPFSRDGGIEVAGQPRYDRLVIQQALHGLAAAGERGLFERASKTQTFADL